MTTNPRYCAHENGVREVGLMLRCIDCNTPVELVAVSEIAASIKHDREWRAALDQQIADLRELLRQHTLDWGGCDHPTDCACSDARARRLLGIFDAEIGAEVVHVARAPCDWDQESYCVEDDCSNPATHERLDSMSGDTPIVELVCCRHAV